MFLRGRFRTLFRDQPRRRNVGPRIVELLEQRVLLTDVAYYDLLKGQNFVQNSTNNPALQTGSPFHLHSSVHSPSGFTSAATVQLPNSTTKTLIEQGSTQFHSLEQSFSTKAALDAAFAAGNYTFTISHPLDINFSPALDASAGVNLAPGSRTFDSHVFEPNSSGNFQETWSPVTPNTLDVTGTITATTITATLTGHVNTAATGSINASWNGSQYVGTYSFNGQNGNVTIPEGYKSTLNLPADAYPNAPHLTNFTAAQTLNPAADFTFTWDTFTGGTADDLITLFLFDGNNQVFHTDAIPLPSGSPQLNGTATSFTLPKNTLQANKTYQGQLWFTNFTTIDTTSFPGAKGTTGYYIATNFTVKTGTAVDTSPPDVLAYYVTKGQEFVQANASTPTLGADSPFFFAAFVEPRDGSTVNGATVTPPTNIVENGPQDLDSGDDESLELLFEFNTKAGLDTAFKSGKYTFAIDTANQGTKIPAVTLPSDAYPVTPHVSNWADAQRVDATSDFTLNWDAFTNGTTGDFIQVSITNSFDEIVFETPGFWETNPLTGTSRSVVIPAGTLEAGETYDAQLLFANASTLDRTTYKNSVGTTAFSKLTTFTIQTIPPEGILQFQSANFSVNENADPSIATITVTRTGGSTGEVEIHYATGAGSANDGSDFTGVSGTLTFANGETSMTFEVPILDDEQSEGHETVALQLTNPTNGAILGTRSSATLTILDNELTFGPGNFIDSDGDKYTIKLTGPGTARIAIDDPDGDGKGSVKAIILTDTTSATSLSLTVTKAATGNGEVSIGRITGNGSLSGITCSKSDLIGIGINLSGTVGSITLDDVLNGADIVVGGVLANSTKFTLGDVAAGTELRSGATVSALTAQTFLGDLIQAPAITALTVNAGSFPADLNVINAVKALTLKAGGASGDWLAGSFGTVSITGGGFTGRIRSTATATQLGTTAAISSFTITGGDFIGQLNTDGLIGTLKTIKSTTGIGGSLVNSTMSASGFTTMSVGRDVINTTILAGAKLGADGLVGGTGPNSDIFGGGKIGSFAVAGDVVSSVVGAGLDPQAILLNGTIDRIVGGITSAIPAMSIGGIASTDSYFAAGLFPATVKVSTFNINPLTDPRFFTGGVSIIDDGDSGFTLAGQWTATTTAGYQKDFRSSASGSGLDTATWTFSVTPGEYRVLTTWTTGTGRATNANYIISAGTTTLEAVTVNQSLVPSDLSNGGVSWGQLGSSYEVFGNTLTVKLTDQANGTVVADAVMVERLGHLTRLPGAIDGLVSDQFPDLAFPAPARRDYAVVSDSFSLSFREVLLVFKNGTTVQQANDVLTANNATVIGALPEGDILLVRLPLDGFDDLAPALEQLNAEPHVELAIMESGGGPSSLPPSNSQPGLWDWNFADSFGSHRSGNWGLEAVRAPQMWNLDSYVRRPENTTKVSAGVVDVGFTDPATTPSASSHPDFRKVDGTSILQISPTFQMPGASRIPAKDHGTMVAGIIGASWDNKKGVEGINPWVDTIQARLFQPELGTWGRQLSEMMHLLRSDSSIKAINYSIGWWQFYQTNGINPPVDVFAVHFDLDGDGHDDTWADVMGRIGSLAIRAANSFARIRGDFIIVGAAGNGNDPSIPVTYSARDESPIANAAFFGDSHFLSVESINRSNSTSTFSDIGGSVSAPGESVRSTETDKDLDGKTIIKNPKTGLTTELPTALNFDDGDTSQWRDGTFDHPLDSLYATNSGTSFAAPYVTGLITALWKLDPNLNVDQVRQLVTDNAFTANVAAGGTPRIDAFAAAMGIDQLPGHTPEMQRHLVDVDDGSLDGNSRIDTDDNNGNGRTDDELTQILNDGRRGDNSVDMKDFRAFRDAVLQVISNGPSSPAIPSTIASLVLLDGRANHPKKDLNGDGLVKLAGAVDSTPSENVYPRFDFNGDGTIERTGILVTPTHAGVAPFKIDPDTPFPAGGETQAGDILKAAGYSRDVDVMADVWNDPTVRRDELSNDGDGDGVIDYFLSADLHLSYRKPPQISEKYPLQVTIESLKDGEVLWTKMLNSADGRWSRTSDTSTATLRRVVTVPLFADRQVRVTVSNGNDLPVTVNLTSLSYGQDVPLELVSPLIKATDLMQKEGSSGGNTPFKFNVTLPIKVPGLVDVQLSTSDGTAFSGVNLLPQATDLADGDAPDYVPVRNTRLRFAANAVTLTTPVTVSVTGDSQMEHDETFDLNFFSNTVVKGGTVESPIYYCIVPSTETATIINDDLPKISIGDTSVTEGDSGDVSATFDVSLSIPSLDDVTFQYSTSLKGTATSNVDYASASNVQVTIPAGETHASISIAVHGDTLNEPNETFFVDLLNVQKAIVSDAQGQGTIVNDDFPTPNTTGTWRGSGFLKNPLSTFPVTYTMRLQTNQFIMPIVTGTISSDGESRTLAGSVTTKQVVINVNNPGFFAFYQLTGRLISSTQMELSVLIIDTFGGRTTSLSPIIFTKIS